MKQRRTYKPGIKNKQKHSNKGKKGSKQNKLIFQTLFLKSIGWLFCRMFLNLALSHVFSSLNLNNPFWPEYHRNADVYFSVHYIKRHLTSHDW